MLGGQRLTEQAYRLCSRADDEIARADEAATTRAEQNPRAQTEVALEEDDDPPLHTALDAVEEAEGELVAVLGKISGGP